MPEKIHQIVVIGAGPYGLAAAQRLRTEGFDVHVFGEPMSFWQEHMPAGMFLRSSWDASNIGSLHGPLTLEAYQKAEDISIPKPIPLNNFIAYGQWFQRQGVPGLDPRRVTHISHGHSGLDLKLDDGETLTANRVMIATGLNRFAQRPALFDAIAPDLVTHAVSEPDLGRFSGKSVAVVGGGQSAIETAALLHERGADVEVIARAPEVRWLARSARLHSLPTQVQHLLYAPTDVGPPGLSWVVALPELFRRLPKRWHAPLAYRAIRPAAAGWLVPRVSNVPITTGCSILNASEANGRLRLRLSDSSERQVDHVLLATGYRIDVGGYGFLDPSIVSSIRHQGGYPLLRNGFESSVPGLHFLGAAAAVSFGPVMRFVSGTWYMTRSLTRRLRYKVEVVR